MFYKFQNIQEEHNLGVGEFLLLVQMKVVVDLAVQVCHPHLAENFTQLSFSLQLALQNAWVLKTTMGTWKGS